MVVLTVMMVVVEKEGLRDQRVLEQGSRLYLEIDDACLLSNQTISYWYFVMQAEQCSTWKIQEEEVN